MTAAVFTRQHDEIRRTHAAEREIAQTRAEFAELFSDLEMSPPAPRDHDTPESYRTRCVERLWPCHPKYDAQEGASLHRLNSRALEADIVARARRLADNPRIGSIRRPGELRRIERTDAAGQMTTEWRGSPLSWMQAFMPPVAQQVIALCDENGRELHLK